VQNKKAAIVQGFVALWVLATVSTYGAQLTPAETGISADDTRNTRMQKIRAKHLDRAAMSVVGRPVGGPAPANVTFDPPYYLEDLVTFLECLATPQPGCNEVDFNGDTALNVLDYGPFQVGFAGHDCNDNRIPDEVDIAQGAADRDLDDIPDECEVVATAFSQGPSGTIAGVPSNIDWSDSDPNVVVADDFTVSDAIIGVVWWGGTPVETLPALAPASTTASAAVASNTVMVSDDASLAANDVAASRDAARSARLQASPSGLAPAAVLEGGDTCATATTIASIPFSGTGNTCPFLDNYDEVCDPTVDFPGSPDVVYKFTPTSDVSLEISLCRDSAYDTKLYVYENTCPTPGSGTFVACNEDFCSTPSNPLPFVSAAIQVPMTAGNTYFIVVDGTADECGAYTLDIVQACAEGRGDCFTEHPTAGCGDTACCALVCDPQVDPFCCDPGSGEWDAFCVGEAFCLCGDPPPPPTCPSGTLLGQPASHCLDEWIGGISDSGWFEGPLQRIESFDGLGEPVCDVHWWGLNARNSGAGFSICDKAPDEYVITFYPDNLGEPDRNNPVCTYTVTPRKEVTGLFYGPYPLYSYSVDLESCCVLSDGWVSIQGISTGDDCVFLWMSSGNEGEGFHFVEEAGALTAQNYDLSLCLTTRISGWFVSFHAPLNAQSGEPAEALGLYFCPRENVARTATQTVPCDAPSSLKYDVDLLDCCLAHSNIDVRNETRPAQIGAFLASSGLAYDFGLQAVTGVRFTKDTQTGECIESLTGEASAVDFWAWHTTDTEAGARSPRQSSLTMGLEGEWLYGPWSPLDPTCGGSHMAFELLSLVPAP